jgi:hypothetical protein
MLLVMSWDFGVEAAVGVNKLKPEKMDAEMLRHIFCTNGSMLQLGITQKREVL